MDFASDNTAGAAPEIVAALAEANAGRVPSYGDDPVTARVQARLAELFETEAAVFPVLTGTAANALALSVMTPPFGAVYCHREAHIEVDECGAPEFYTGGAKLVPLAGDDGRISPATLERVLAHAHVGFVHAVQPAALSLTQLSECGTAYGLDDIALLAEIAHGHGLGVHMDGARFANALVHLGCTPAAMTWRAGVDVLSFGATKNGAWAAEAVVVFRPELAREMAYRRKRAGHLLSKMRFVSAQLDAYLADDVWRRNAEHANRMAALLAKGLANAGVEILYPVDGNQIFVRLPAAVIRALRGDGFVFHDWDAGGPEAIRLVTAFCTRADEVRAFVAAVARHA